MTGTELDISRYCNVSITFAPESEVPYQYIETFVPRKENVLELSLLGAKIRERTVQPKLDRFNSVLFSRQRSVIQYQSSTDSPASDHNS